MKVTVVVLAVVSSFSLLPSSFSQGPLTPPGPPSPTFKTLDQLEPRTPISALPATISTAGSYYVTTNLTCTACGAGTNGITISADDVTLDLSGFRLFGLAGSGSGVLVPSTQKNLHIRNGTLRSWPVSGVDTFNASNSRLEHLRAFGNGGGLRVGDDSAVAGCEVTSNSKTGIVAGSGCIVRDCTVADNTAGGIQVGAGSTVLGCTARANGVFGMLVNSDSMVAECTVAGGVTGAVGINAVFRSTIRSCNVVSNSGDGIRVNSNCLVLENNCSANGALATDAGINVGGSGNRIEGNTVTTNKVGGITVITVGNLIIRNSARNNTTNYVITAGNTLGPTTNLIGAGGIITNQNPWANFSF